MSHSEFGLGMHHACTIAMSFVFVVIRDPFTTANNSQTEKDAKPFGTGKRRPRPPDSRLEKGLTAKIRTFPLQSSDKARPRLLTLRSTQRSTWTRVSNAS